VKDKRVKKGKVEYLIKWKGFDNPNEDTWEPVGKLFSYPLLLLLTPVGSHLSSGQASSRTCLQKDTPPGGQASRRAGL